MSSNVFELHKNSSNAEIAEEFRRFADRIEKDEFGPIFTGLVVMQSKIEQKVTRHIVGETLSYSAMMGLLTYVSHMLYEETLR